MKQYLNLKSNKLITYNDKIAAVLIRRGDIAEVEIKTKVEPKVEIPVKTGRKNG